MMNFLRLFAFSSFFIFLNNTVYATSDVTITSVALPAGNMNQGSANNIVYIAKVVVATDPVTINSVVVNLGGNFDSDDLANIGLYYNFNTPSLTGASAAGNTAAGFAAPHVFTLAGGRVVPAGSTIYILVVATVSSTATDNHIVKINGATDPLTLNTTGLPNITNSQTDLAETQTIQAADITLTSIATAAGNLNQGSSNDVIAITKLDVATEPITITSIQASLGGNFDNNDIQNISVYYNPTAPSLSGSSSGGNVAANFAAPHLFTLPAGRVVAAGSTLYILIVVTVNATATDGNTVLINGATAPIIVNTLTAPNITNSQSDIAGTQTIQAADINLATISLPAAGINQGSSNNIVYIQKLEVATEPFTINSVQLNLGGNFDADDIVSVGLNYNINAPTLAGSASAGNLSSGFAAPHTFTIPGGRVVAAGSTIYLLITVNVASSATDEHTVFVNGSANPLIINTSTTPNFTDNQSNTAGVQTIQAADLAISTVELPAASLNPGTANNIVYVAKLTVGTEPVVVNSIQATLSGSFDDNDLSNVSLFYNVNAPNLAGASSSGNVPGGFAAPHSFTIPGGRVIPAGTTLYIIITANLSASATDNHTITINGATDPLILNTSTVPNVANTQTNNAGVQTIQASDIILTTVALSNNNITPGSANNIVYIAKVDVGTAPVTSTGLQFTLNGTYDNDDLTSLNVFYNPSGPTLTGASSFSGAAATVDGPHTFTINSGRLLAAGTVNYFLFTVGLSSTANQSHTVFVNGATEPVVFTYTTTPSVTNNQSNSAGIFTISNAVLPLTLQSFNAEKLSTNHTQLQWLTAAEINTLKFEVQWSTAGSSFAPIATIAAQGNSQVNQQYSFIHNAPASGDNFYRLKMIDIDGQFTYSPIVKLFFNAVSPSVTIAPNPVTSQLRLVIKNSVPVKMLRIIDPGGRVVWQSASIINTGVVSIPFSSFGKGLYTAELFMEHTVEHLSFVKAGN